MKCMRKNYCCYLLLVVLLGFSLPQTPPEQPPETLPPIIHEPPPEVDELQYKQFKKLYDTNASQPTATGAGVYETAGGKILVASESGIEYSSDGGDSFTVKEGTYDYYFFWDTGSRIYACPQDENDVVAFSDNEGADWDTTTIVSTNLPGTFVGEDVWVMNSNLYILVLDGTDTKIFVYDDITPEWDLKATLASTSEAGPGSVVGTTFYFAVESGTDMKICSYADGAGSITTITTLSSYSSSGTTHLWATDANQQFVTGMEKAGNVETVFTSDGWTSTTVIFSDGGFGMQGPLHRYVSGYDHTWFFHKLTGVIYRLSVEENSFEYFQDLSTILTIGEFGYDIYGSTQDGLLLDDSGMDWYSLQDNLSNTFRSVDAVLEMGAESRAEVRAKSTPLDDNQFIWFHDDSDNLLFQGKPKKEKGAGQGLFYRLEGLDKNPLEIPVSLSYTSATSVHTIARAAVDAVGVYLSWTSGSIPDPSVTHIATWEKIPLRELLDELADLIDGAWYVDPEGIVYLIKVTSLTSTGITKTQASGDCSSPEYILINEISNYIHLYGRGYLESDGVSQDAASIIQDGLKELVRYYPGVTDQTKLDAIAASLLAMDGVGASPPIEIIFLIKQQGYVQPGEELNLQWTYIARLDTATDYIVKKCIFHIGDNTTIFLTNTIFQEGREYGAAITRKPTENEQQIRNVKENLEQVPITPIHFNGGGGFAEYVGYGSALSRACNQDSGYVAASFFVKTGGTFRLRFFCRTDTAVLTGSSIASGVLYINAQADSEALSYNIYSATNHDLSLDTVDDMIFQDTDGGSGHAAEFTIGDNEFVGIQWTKDSTCNGAAGSLYIYSMVLMRQ